MLADLENNGKIHLAFVYRGNSENTEAFLIKQDEILKGLEGEVNNDESINGIDNVKVEKQSEVVAGE